MTPTPPRPIESVDGRTRRRIRSAAQLYDAACELLETRSFDDLSVGDVCSRAGVGRATFFRIFETKAGLIREFNRRLAVDAEARIVADGGDVNLGATLEHVRAAVYDGWGSAGPGHSKMIEEFVRATQPTELHSGHPELLGVVVDAVSRAVAAGEVNGDVPIELTASLALLHIITPMSDVLAGRPSDGERLSRVLLSQFLRGVVQS